MYQGIYYITISKSIIILRIFVLWIGDSLVMNCEISKALTSCLCEILPPDVRNIACACGMRNAASEMSDTMPAMKLSARLLKYTWRLPIASSDREVKSLVGPLTEVTSCC